MKKSLVVFVLVVLVQLGKVQAQYIPMAVDSAVWLIVEEDLFTGLPIQRFGFYTYGDTMINNLSYKKVYSIGDSSTYGNDLLFMLLRDNIFTRTVHGINMTNFSTCPTGIDYPFFDFSTFLSDSSFVTICSSQESVFNIDSLLIYGKMRKIVDGSFGRWIEGVGNRTFGVEPFSLGNYRLINYCRGTPSDCSGYNWVSTNETKTYQQGKLFPNPARDQVRLELDHYIQNGTIKIIDTFGRVHQLLGFEGNESSIDIADLAHGMYIVQVFEEDELRYSDKLMVVD